MDNKKIKLSIVGTNGIPANYGGFETLVEYLAENLNEDLDITIWCSGLNYSKKFEFYKGCKLKYINLSANNWQSIIYDITTIILSIRGCDKILILGSSGALILPVLFGYRKKIIFNFGGLDWQRSKWGMVAKFILYISEYLGVKFSDEVICDNQGIKDYVEKKYKKKSYLIEYGGDNVIQHKDLPLLPEYGKDIGDLGYFLTVARIQSDNNIEIMLEAFSKDVTLPYVLVGNFESSEYGKYIKMKYKNRKNIILYDAIYDEYKLNSLRANCSLYVHGHSAGGTNPALVEAMNFAKPIICYDCQYNRYTTEDRAVYFKDANDLNLKARLMLSELDTTVKISKDMSLIAARRYTWARITKMYLDVIRK